MSAAERVIRRAEHERLLKELGDARENRDRRPVLPHPCDPEIARLRRLYLGPLAVFRFRRRARYLRLNERTTMPRPAGPAELAQLLMDRSKHLRQWPEDVLRDVCADAREHIGFAGEIVCHEGEWWHSHRVIVLLEGTLGVAPPGCTLTVADAATAYTLLSDCRKNGTNPQTVPLLQSTTPSRLFDAPAVVGEVTVLSQSAATSALRVVSPTCRYVAVSAAKLHAALAAGRVPADAVAAAFGPEVVRAREAVLRQHFPQTEPLMKQCWVCEGMTSAEVHAVVAGLRPAVFLPGQDVVVQGDAAATMYFLRRGSAAVVIGGKPIPGVVVGAGKTFGEMGVLFREPRMATIRALSVVDTWELSKDALERIIRHSPVRATIAAKAASIRQGWISRVPRDVVPAALRKHSILRNIPDSAIDELTKRAEARVFTPGQLLTMVARVTDEMLVVFGGTATAQDVTGRKFTKGDVIAPYALCPHRGYETVASSTMLDAFALSRTLLEEVLKKHGCYEKAMRQLHGELELMARTSSSPNMILVPESQLNNPHIRMPASISSQEVLARLAGASRVLPPPSPDPADLTEEEQAMREDAAYWQSEQWNKGLPLLQKDPKFIPTLSELPSRSHRFFCSQLIEFNIALQEAGGDRRKMPHRAHVVKYDLFGLPSESNGSLVVKPTPPSRPLTPSVSFRAAVNAVRAASRLSAAVSPAGSLAGTPSRGLRARGGVSPMASASFSPCAYGNASIEDIRCGLPLPDDDDDDEAILGRLPDAALGATVGPGSPLITEQATAGGVVALESSPGPQPPSRPLPPGYVSLRPPISPSAFNNGRAPAPPSEPPTPQRFSRPVSPSTVPSPGRRMEAPQITEMLGNLFGALTADDLEDACRRDDEGENVAQERDDAGDLWADLNREANAEADRLRRDRESAEREAMERQKAEMAEMRARKQQRSAGIVSPTEESEISQQQQQQQQQQRAADVTARAAPAVTQSASFVKPLVLTSAPMQRLQVASTREEQLTPASRRTDSTVHVRPASAQSSRVSQTSRLSSSSGRYTPQPATSRPRSAAAAKPYVPTQRTAVTLVKPGNSNNGVAASLAASRSASSGQRRGAAAVTAPPRGPAARCTATPRSMTPSLAPSRRGYVALSPSLLATVPALQR